MLKNNATFKREYIKEQIVKYVDTLYSILNLMDLPKMENAL